MSKFFLYLVLMAVCSVHCNVTSSCGQKELCDSYLDLAVDMIVRAKGSIPTCDNSHQKLKPVDCADVLQMGHNTSGVYEIWPLNRVTEGKRLDVYCDMDTNGGGWTVIQRRGDFGSPNDYFYRKWESYKEGFGEIQKDFWLGNDNIFALTHQKLYSVRFDLKDFDQNRSYAVYDKFWIDDEYHNYTLHISAYNGDAGDAMYYHDNQAFSTLDRDNDKSEAKSCAEQYKSSWWHNGCYHADLNGLYQNRTSYKTLGISWYKWKGIKESLEWTEIKIRPKSFKVPH